jgi:hypothetical protein
VSERPVKATSPLPAGEEYARMHYAKSRKTTRPVERFLDEHKIEYRLERRKKHPAIVIMHEGKPIPFFHPLTPSTQNWHYRLISTMRRRLGLIDR